MKFFFSVKKNILRRRRNTLYRMALKRGNGNVLCLICGKHVCEADVSLEHIRPRSRGGSDDMSNLGITHRACNTKRGSRSIEAARRAVALANYKQEEE
jgi:5-methylcytosine-specific restriction endonuclease McrA